MSVGLDARKPLVFRPFRQVSARIGGIAVDTRAAASRPLLSSERGFLCNLCLSRGFLPLPSLRTP
ncbi:hypothetical protein BS629_34070 [Rhizobium leguminosarum bv. viciae USDA 2370]|nr:hypothetical protein BS629_34070 [Rhizobium leguminosarum bv. viciae USDA 2370]